MKALNLTEEHKAKLLEMCIELFQNHTDYNHIGILGNNNIKLYKNYSNNKYRTYSIKGTISIHWFEFCMLHLAPKIIYPLYIPKNANSDEGGQIGMEEFGNAVLYHPKAHPVDYLYEQFKELK